MTTTTANPVAVADHAVDRSAIGGMAVSAAQTNLIALRELREGEQRPEVLQRFMGWGAASDDILVRSDDELDEDGQPLAWQIRQLMTRSEHLAAKRSTLNAYYTPPWLIEAMWGMVAHLGFDGGRILEPACGILRFRQHQPEAMRDRSEWVAVEAENISAEIAQVLHPDAKLYHSRFEQVALPEGFADLVIGNFPFGQDIPNDPTHNRDSRLIHSYFLRRSIFHLRPGGLLCVITGQGTLDSDRDEPLRKEMAEQGELLLNVRLPHDVHTGAGAACDLLIFRKYQRGESAADKPVPLWTKSYRPAGVSVNGSYLNEFLRGKLREEQATWDKYLEAKKKAKAKNEKPPKKPDLEYLHADPKRFIFGQYATSQVLGTLAGNPRYWCKRITVNPDKRDLSKAIANLYDLLPAGIYDESDRLAEIAFLPDEFQRLPVGSLVTYEGELWVRGAVSLRRVDDTQRQRIEMGLAIHADFMALLEHERTSEDDEVADDLRAKLRKSLFEFKINFGNLLDAVNQDAFGTDPKLCTISALEYKNPDTGEIEPTDILEKRTMRPAPQPGKCDTVGDALSQCLNVWGMLDVAAIAEYLEVTEAEAQEQLLAEGLAYYDPEQMDWVEATEYLSGDVKTKLEQANEHELLPNIEALKQVQPDPVLPPAAMDIMETCAEKLGIPIHIYSESAREKLFTETLAVQMHAAWLPEWVIHDFVCHLLSVDAESITVNHVLSPSPSWSVSGDAAARSSQGNLVTWAGEDYNALALIQIALNNGEPKVYLPKKQGGGLDKESTAKNQSRLEDIREAFDGWLWQDRERAIELCLLYNDKINRYRHRSFNGAHLTLPGSNPDIILRPHQKTVVWRALTQMQGKGTLMGHAVGAGKTLAMAAICMEARRLGLAQKPIIAVQKDTLGSIVREFQWLYPNARLLYAQNEEEVSGSNRQRFIDRIAFGDWDAVIVHHDLFFEISMSEESMMAYLEDLLLKHEAALDSDELDKSQKRSIERQKMTIENRIATVSESYRKQHGLNFEQTGIDLFLLDESQVVKKLGFYTQHREVRGLDSGFSQRAIDTKIKCDYLYEHTGRVVFATGTPITNTLGEMFNLMQFLCPGVLKELGLDSFDAWASMFAEVEVKPEIDTVGEYKPLKRFSRFTNLPELMALFWDVGDLVLGEDLDIPRPKPHFIEALTQPTDALVTYMDFLAHRAGLIQAKSPMKIPSRAKQLPGFITVVDQFGDPYHVKRSWINDHAVIEGSADHEEWDLGANELRFQVRRTTYVCDFDAFYQVAKKSESEDMMLLVTNHGRQSALDPRLVEDSLPDDPGSKLNHAVWCIWQIWRETKSVKGTQMVFSSVGIPKFDGNFNVFEEMANKLAMLGVPRREIAFVHDAKSADDRVTLFQQVKDGDVRVLFGSTEKGGTGVNVQDRLVALHHMEPHWKPSDIEQREGRIIRQGNLWKEVLVFRHVCEGRTGSAGFDAFLWQKLKQKQTFISQVFRKTLPSRHTEDLGETVMNFQQVMAIASGNDVLKDQAELQQEEKKLTTKAASVMAQRAAISSEIKKLKRFMNSAVKLQDMLDKEAQLVADNWDGAITIGIKEESAPTAIGDRITSKFKQLEKKNRGGMSGLVKFGHVPSTGHVIEGRVTLGKHYLFLRHPDHREHVTHDLMLSLGNGKTYVGSQILNFVEHAIPNAAKEHAAETKTKAKNLKELEAQPLPTFAGADRLNEVKAKLKEIDQAMKAAEKAAAEERKRQRAEKEAALRAEGKSDVEIAEALDDSKRFKQFKFRQAKLYTPDPDVVAALRDCPAEPDWLPLLRRMVSEFGVCDNSEDGSTESPETVAEVTDDGVLEEDVVFFF